MIPCDGSRWTRLTSAASFSARRGFAVTSRGLAFTYLDVPITFFTAWSSLTNERSNLLAAAGALKLFNASSSHAYSALRVCCRFQSSDARVDTADADKHDRLSATRPPGCRTVASCFLSKIPLSCPTLPTRSQFVLPTLPHLSPRRLSRHCAWLLRGLRSLRLRSCCKTPPLQPATRAPQHRVPHRRRHHRQ